MKLIDEWKSVLAKSWSVRVGGLMIVAGLLYAFVPGAAQLLRPGSAGIIVVALAAMYTIVRVTNQNPNGFWVDEWKAVLAKATSMKFNYLIAITGAAEAALPYFGNAIAPRALGITLALLALLGQAFRVLDQSNDAVTSTDAGFRKPPPPDDPIEGVDGVA